MRYLVPLHKAPGGMASAERVSQIITSPFFLTLRGKPFTAVDSPVYFQLYAPCQRGGTCPEVHQPAKVDYCQKIHSSSGTHCTEKIILQGGLPDSALVRIFRAHDYPVHDDVHNIQTHEGQDFFRSYNPPADAHSLCADPGIFKNGMRQKRACAHFQTPSTLINYPVLSFQNI